VSRIQKASQATTGPRTRLYRTVEIINGREVVRYSDKPAAGSEVFKAANRR
jgi:hypothetical protein